MSLNVACKNVWDDGAVLGPALVRWRATFCAELSRAEISIDSRTSLFVIVLVIFDQPQLRCAEQIGISSQSVCDGGGRMDGCGDACIRMRAGEGPQVPSPVEHSPK